MTLAHEIDFGERLDLLDRQLEMLIHEAAERQRLREKMAELSTDLIPVARQAMGSVTSGLAAAEERGYFEFAGSSVRVLDKVVTGFSADDVAALGDNIVLMLETVKEMTQPEVLQMMRSTLHQVKQAESPVDPPSLLSLLRRLRDPGVRRGLDRLLVLLDSLGSTDSHSDSERRLEE